LSCLRRVRGGERSRRLVEHFMWRSSRDVKRSEPETRSGTRAAGTYIPWESGADVATDWIAQGGARDEC
jgi:hypothetical protein